VFVRARQLALPIAVTLVVIALTTVNLLSSMKIGFVPPYIGPSGFSCLAVVGPHAPRPGEQLATGDLIDLRQMDLNSRAILLLAPETNPAEDDQAVLTILTNGPVFDVPLRLDVDQDRWNINTIRTFSAKALLLLLGAYFMWGGKTRSAQLVGYTSLLATASMYTEFAILPPILRFVGHDLEIALGYVANFTFVVYALNLARFVFSWLIRTAILVLYGLLLVAGYLLIQVPQAIQIISGCAWPPAPIGISLGAATGLGAALIPLFVLGFTAVKSRFGLRRESAGMMIASAGLLTGYVANVSAGLFGVNVVSDTVLAALFVSVPLVFSVTRVAERLRWNAIPLIIIFNTLLFLILSNVANAAIAAGLNLLSTLIFLARAKSETVSTPLLTRLSELNSVERLAADLRDSAKKPSLSDILERVRTSASSGPVSIYRSDRGALMGVASTRPSRLRKAPTILPEQVRLGFSPVYFYRLEKPLEAEGVCIAPLLNTWRRISGVLWIEGLEEPNTKSASVYHSIESLAAKLSAYV